MKKVVLKEQYEELSEQIKILCDIIKDAADTVVVSVESVEDVREADVEATEDIITGLRRKVAGALDILISAVEELLDIFEYEVGEGEPEILAGEEIGVEEIEAEEMEVEGEEEEEGEGE